MIEKNVSEKEVGELFLVQLNQQDLQKLGFSSTLEKVQYANVFLLWEGDDFYIKFVWVSGEDIKEYIQNVNRVPKWIYHYIIDKYIET